MGRPRKANRTKVKLSDGSEHVAITISDSTVVEAPPQTTSEAIAREEAEDVQDSITLYKIQENQRTWEQGDGMTTWLKETFKLAYLMPEIRYKDSRFPKDENGFVMSVNRFYPSLSLVVDKIPTKWTEEMIEAKKWGVEKIGFKYCWVQDGELLTPEQVYDRTEKLKKEPKFKFEFEIKKPVFYGDMKMVVN